MLIHTQTKHFLNAYRHCARKWSLNQSYVKIFSLTVFSIQMSVKSWHCVGSGSVTGMSLHSASADAA
jgi:hypothetical protein